ncbi:MAG: ferredoxin [Acidimicrobiia bacterium]|nr:ferredoxin [Acidimicrobiia bacterium]
MTAPVTVEVDQELCIGSGDCVSFAPKAFSLESGEPTATVLPGAGDAALAALQDAEMNCPTGAIRITVLET